MACVTVTIAEAIAVTIAEKVTKRKEKRLSSSGVQSENRHAMPFSKKLSVLKKMLWGGSVLLLLEHIWHGEITPFFPFFTAAYSQEALGEMFREMATTGVLMSVAVTALWGVMMFAYEKANKKTTKNEET